MHHQNRNYNQTLRSYEQNQQHGFGNNPNNSRGGGPIRRRTGYILFIFV